MLNTFQNKTHAAIRPSTEYVTAEKIAVVGLGYVGLPVAVAAAAKFPGAIGFDISTRRIDALLKGEDATGEIEPERLKASGLTFSTMPDAMKGCTFFIVTVPTPIDNQNRPDLSPLDKACELVGPALTPGSIVVFESTVYPGVTEDYCAPRLEKYSGLKRGSGFKLGYSPERINPGDKEHRFEKILKVISAEDAESLARVRHVYGSIVEAGLFEASSIKVAEAAKVLENTQRDLNIALMNELSLILDRMGISTREVLAAAGTKWNFLKFSPGLVGGHCIGVDPYYLTAAAEGLGYRPEVILAGRRVNDGMGAFIAEKSVKLMLQQGLNPKTAKIGIFGVTFKENVPDIRNSKVFDIVREFKSYGLTPLLTDPLAQSSHTMHEYGEEVSEAHLLDDLDVLLFAVPHLEYAGDLAGLQKKLKPGGILVDVKSVIAPSQRRSDIVYWSL
ncbi:nucleotide sugar dehydrogenase [Aestuariivirga litoralis]|uniref:nucleotide sugar dehydrogenase n=1 Tax=Aestuariivirga litoralis TaxID=2650924 RepID=UPI0018C5A85F|nr:nucleotide sugar dehydrogenase [Aestuariivirga litoralis]MBG1233226.1 nucleotide sugar dehydrogenase [Aestuariivirga litoralis]